VGQVSCGQLANAIFYHRRILERRATINEGVFTSMMPLSIP
jgi:hypothetical protein